MDMGEGSGMSGFQYNYRFDHPQNYLPRSDPVRVQDPRNRRIVLRENLIGQFIPSQTQVSEWTDKYWKKAGSDEDEDQEMTPMESLMNLHCTGFQNQNWLNRVLAQPVNMGKAESMMQKMGWQGGALGRTGEGIIEPITPNTAYSTKFGLGCFTEDVEDYTESIYFNRSPVEIFDINALLHIEEFVKNNTETEILFDNNLSRAERKRLHHLVENLLNAENVGLIDYSCNYALELATSILNQNCYTLATESEGEHPNRMLCLYKTASVGMYLIVPEDLRYDEAAGGAEDAAFENDERNFLQNLTDALLQCHTVDPAKCDNNCKHASKNVTKISEYFAEFGHSMEYSVFRHLGPFSKEEKEEFSFFYNMAYKYQNGEAICAKLHSIFEKVNFEIITDCNNHTVIKKKT